MGQSCIILYVAVLVRWKGGNVSGKKKIIIAVAAALILIPGIIVALQGGGSVQPEYEPDVVEEEYIEEYSRTNTEPSPVENTTSEEFLGKIYNHIQRTMGNNYITAFELNDGVLTIVLDLPECPPPQERYETVTLLAVPDIQESMDVEWIMLRTPRWNAMAIITTQITGIILADERFDEHWDRVVIYFECTGQMSFGKSDIIYVPGLINPHHEYRHFRGHYSWRQLQMANWQ